ncbi:unnamed protein product [Phyllotreta striolata]|uniref:Adenosine 5'-monophosphoramidase HINT3 n=1 Tax=Phyllotreta striolata TaxID=444603 RepID=A0A9N9XU94_PHYSR|nr:unnamed protein product [Phyllotreta striolata]
MASASCIFCKIISGSAPATKLFENEEFVAFKDIKPAANFHCLVIPKQHILNIKSLSTHEDKLLVERMMQVGKRILEENNGNLNDLRLGFHCPPFNSVGHLHMHVISPASEMSLYNKLIFQPNTYWFQSAEDTLNQLNNKL